MPCGNAWHSISRNSIEPILSQGTQGMLTAIEVQNYRSFVKPARIELRPITILLGRNSAGKSSLTRLFPLLQESMGRATSAPVLWSSNIVDFGKISDVISRHNIHEGLRLSFEANISNSRRLRRFSTEWDNDRQLYTLRTEKSRE